MEITKFMQVMFSAAEAGDEELAGQVANDIETAKTAGEVATDEVNYVNLGSGKVMIVDKVNGECTIAEAAPDETETYDLIAVPNEEIDKFLHPLEDGVTADPRVMDHADEHVEDHLDGMGISFEGAPSVEGLSEDEDGVKVFSDNTVVLRVFSDQAFCERIFSEVISSEDTAVVGNLKVEKVDDDTILVTDTESGDQAKVELDEDGMDVTELDQKELSYSDLEDGEEGPDQFEPVFVVGIDPQEHVIVDAPVYDPAEAEDLAQQLSEIGVEAVEIFDDPMEARDHANSLLGEVGVSEVEQLAEPEQAEFSDTTIWVTRYFAEEPCTQFMYRLFSETEDNCECQKSIEDAIESGEEIEDDHKIITPVDSKTAVIEDKDNGEFTKAVLDGEDMDVEKITEEEASELTEDLATNDPEAEEEEKAYALASLTDFEYRLYSEEESGSVANEEKVTDAIESGEQIETAQEVITPVDSETAVVEDKESGEFTKVTLDEDGLETEEISEEEADELTEDLATEDPEEEKKYSYTIERVTSYMERLYSEEEDSSEIEDAIESGESIEDSDKKITPVDSKTAVIEDKENGEFTKATIEDDDLNVEAISEDEASELLEDVAEEETEDETAEREYSEWLSEDTLGRFFGTVEEQAMMAPPQQPMPQEGMPMDPQGMPMPAPAEGGQDPVQSVENIEDKALVAVQSIQDAANQAVQAITAAKEAPAPGEGEDLQEAQFSSRYFSDTEDTLSNWLNFK